MATQLIFKARQPRRLMGTIMEVALLHNSKDNNRCEMIREVYPFLDDVARQQGGEYTMSDGLREALTVADFPLYFNRTLSRAVYDRYQYRTGDWRDYTTPDQLPDYTIGERFRFSEFSRPVLRREKEEAYAGYFTESRLQIQVSDYAKQIDFSRRILANDDLGAFNNIANMMSDSCVRFWDFYVSALYDNALTQAALGVLGAGYAGTGALTTANLMIGWNAFVTRVDARGNPLNIMPQYLVIPPILRLAANQILQSERIAELATNGVNPMRNALQVREDPYIAYTAPNYPWYLFADPSSIPAVTVVKWQQRPQDYYIYAKAPDKLPMSMSGGLSSADWRMGSFLTGDIEIAVELTVGSRVDDPTGLVGVTDANGIYYSSGTTP